MRFRFRRTKTGKTYIVVSEIGAAILAQGDINPRAISFKNTLKSIGFNHYLGPFSTPTKDSDYKKCEYRLYVYYDIQKAYREYWNDIIKEIEHV